MLNNYPDTFAFVQIHHGDAYATAWGNARFNFYTDTTGWPTTLFDGTVKHSGSHIYSIYENEFLSRATIPTDVTIELTGDPVSGQTYSVEAKVCVESTGGAKTMRIYMVQVLDYWPASPSYHRQGFKQAADVHGSEPDIYLAAGECQTIVKQFTFDAGSWASQDDITIIAWAQEPQASSPPSDRAEVFQAAIMNWPFPPSNALIIDLPNGVPEYIPPAVPTDITVQVEDASETYVPGSGLLHYRYDGGDFLTSGLASLGGDLYQATLPAPDCDSTPEFYISADGDEGTTVYSPEDAPASLYTAMVGTVTVILDDNFETDQGWTVVNDPSLTGGAWERGVPVAEPDDTRHPPREDYDGSGQCYLTQNVAGNSDVDYGPTTLISPTFNLSDTNDPILRFARWWWNDDQDADPMDVEISNDDGGTWVPVLTITNVPAEWFQQAIYVAPAIDPLPLTNQMKVRISVMDDPNDSRDEGGIDAMEVFDVECGGIEVVPLSVGSCQDHSGTERCIDIGEGGARADNVEPRMQQGVPLELEVTCDGNVGSATASVTCTPGAYGGTATVVADGSAVVRVQFSQVLPNKSCCTLTFGGDIAGCWPIAMLEGDVNFDCSVSTADASSVKQRLENPVDETNFQYDVNRDDSISTADGSNIKGRLEDTVPCPCTCP